MNAGLQQKPEECQEKEYSCKDNGYSVGPGTTLVIQGAKLPKDALIQDQHSSFAEIQSPQCNKVIAI
jgi:hypothetical protein